MRYFLFFFILVFLILGYNLDAQTLLKRHMAEKIPLELVKKHKVKSIDYNNYIEEFDENGNISYEKGSEWPHGRRYSNIYNEKDQLVMRYSFDDEDTDTIRHEIFTYNSIGKLAEIEFRDTLVKYVTKYAYNSAGYAVSVKSPFAYETYWYDLNGSIKKVKLSRKGEYLAQGSTKFVWEAEYESDRIIKEIVTQDKNYKITWYYKYNQDSKLIESRNDKTQARKSIFIIRYAYNDRDLISERKYYDINDLQLYQQKIRYEYY